MPCRAMFVMLLALFAVGASMGTLGAVEVIFTVDPTVTGLTLTGSDAYYSPTASFVAQQAGSNKAPVSGNFVVDFDPSSSAPPTIQFLGNQGGYIAMGNAIVNASPGSGPANVAVKTNNFPGAHAVGAFRQTAWDWSSAPITVADSQFASNQVNWDTSSGELDLTEPNLGFNNFPVALAGFSGPDSSPSSGSLSQAGAGNWSLSLPITVNINYYGIAGTFTGNLLATAQFSSANIATPTDPTQPTSVLGGTTQIGGVTAQFSAGTTSGSFSAQQIPLTGLPQAALSGLSALGFGSVTQSVQAWDLQYSGVITGPITVTLDYDPSKLPAALQANPSAIVIDHFNDLTQKWETIVPNSIDAANHTVTISLTSLSPLVVGVPEPSSLVLVGLGLAGLGLAARRKRTGVA